MVSLCWRGFVGCISESLNDWLWGKERRGELRRDRSGRTDAFFCPAQPRCLCLCLCRSRCDDAMRPTFSLRASQIHPNSSPEERPPVLCTCSRGGKVRSKLKDTLNMASPIPVPLPRNSSSDPILASAEGSGREADRFNTSQYNPLTRRASTLSPE
jgi:hypothetical protein